MNYRMGLDIGITSVGWAVLQNDNNEEPERIIDLGVRIFEAAEHPKDGSSLALPRREKRSARRRNRRHKHRIERIKQLFDIKPDEWQNFLFNENVYELRYLALESLLNREQWIRVLINIAQRRGFKSNRKSEIKEKEIGKLLSATEENKKLLESKHYRTVGEMLYKDNKFKETLPDGTVLLKVRNKPESYEHTILRDMLIEEIRVLFNIQRDFGNPLASVEIEEEYLDVFTKQRSFDQGPGGNSPYSGDMIEKMLGNCTFEQEEKRAVKASYTFEYFCLLQNINKQKISMNDTKRSFTKEERSLLISLAHEKEKVTYMQVKKALGLNNDCIFTVLNYGNKGLEEVEKATFANMKFYHMARKAFDKVSKGLFQSVSKEVLDEIAYIITCYKSDEKRIAKFNKLGLDEPVINAILPLEYTKTGNLSIKAMRKIIPFLEEGYLYDKACALAGYNHASEKSKYLNPKALEQILNPVVRRSISQTIKVVNAIIREYGSPQLVCVELAREMSKDKKERDNLSKMMKENEEYNEKIVGLLKEMGLAKPSGQDIVKYKLWLEQNEHCAYSGVHLDSRKLFDGGYVDVDHIIPYSISFDDSYNNKILVLSKENRQKGNRIPYEYMKSDEVKWHNFEVFVNTYIKNHKKKELLLNKSLNEDEQRDFKERNLNDTRYISRFVFNLIKDTLEFAPSKKYEKKPVIAVNGAVTAYMRKRWGLNKDREENDLHHAQDAVVIACISDGLIQKVSRYANKLELSESKDGYIDYRTGEIFSKDEYQKQLDSRFPKPWTDFKEELIIRLSQDPNNYINQLVRIGYPYDAKIKPVFVSRMPKRGVTGEGHQDTIRSPKLIEQNMTITKTDIKKLKLDRYGEIENYYNSASDLLLYNALIKQLKMFGGNAEKAFAEPFYKPKSDGTLGNSVKKVKICSATTLGVFVNNEKGYAANAVGAMIRIDIFKENDKYYIVPVYVADTVKKELPNKAIVAAKPYNQWKEMKEGNFIFSLYPQDLFKVTSKSSIKLTKKANNSKESKTSKEWLLYYVKTGISTNSITANNHDKSYSISSLGIQNLEDIQKCQVDVLGNITYVKKEKRQGFDNKR